MFALFSNALRNRKRDAVSYTGCRGWGGVYYTGGFGGNVLHWRN